MPSSDGVALAVELRPNLDDVHSHKPAPGLPLAFRPCPQLPSAMAKPSVPSDAIRAGPPAANGGACWLDPSAGDVRRTCSWSVASHVRPESHERAPHIGAWAAREPGSGPAVSFSGCHAANSGPPSTATRSPASGGNEQVQAERGSRPMPSGQPSFGADALKPENGGSCERKFQWRPLSVLATSTRDRLPGNVGPGVEQNSAASVSLHPAPTSSVM